MKKLILSAIVAVGLVGSAFAQAVSADIILGFRDTSNPGAGNLMINLGNVSEFATGSHLITNLTNSGTYGASTIDSIFGAGWNTNSNLKWAAVGGVNNTDTTNPNGIKNTLWNTKAANGSTLNGTASSTSYGFQSQGNQNAANSLITTMYTNFTSGDFKTATTTATGSWSKQGVPASGSTYFGFFTNGPTQLENSTSITGSYVSSDLWQLTPTVVGGATGSSTFLGTLAIYANGDVSFTAFQAIPEPSTYAALLGVATLGVVAIRRRRQAALEIA